MYISKLVIEGYRCFNEKTEIPLNEGLTVILGENGSGKSAIIDAIRLILNEDEFGNVKITEKEFWHSIGNTKNEIRSNFTIDLIFSGLNEKEQLAYLPWLNPNDLCSASLHLKVQNKTNSRNQYKRELWGGNSSSSIFEWDTYNSIQCTYLPPLRDAEQRLRAVRGSRLARLITKMESKNNARERLEDIVKQNNKELLKDELIVKAKDNIKNRLIESLGEQLAQDISVSFSETRFERIIENLKLLFYPLLDNEVSVEEFRELSENSLGYNNLIYLATVLAELEQTEENELSTRILLIEEPEAHLHPQLQTKLLEYIEKQARISGVQVIVTTHSPIIASSVDLNNILVVKRTDFNNSPTIVPLKNVGLTPKQKFFLQRWMDITKSTLLFARGVILVEGIAEGLVIPELAKRVLHKYLNSKKKISDYSLEEYSVSVINMGGIYFESFFQLFMNAEEQGKGIPIRCAGITDCDPKESDTPYVGNECECNNPALKLQMILKDNKYCRLYSNSKTFEYDLALCGNNFLVMVDTFLEILETDGSIREDFEKYKKEFIRKTDSEKAKIAKCLLDRIDNPKLCGKGLFAQHLAYKLANEEIEFTVPNYIEKAILWACNLNERSESNVPTNSGN
ncbi:AAA family ATPase [Geobacillus zalihae]|uniref:AAA family ATPase n=2 Tax=Geobacillus zalihae TaxID=213419 RepID=A0A7H1RXG3_9BACL|nr:MULTISPECIES: AAA family ATPase [Geobacillus]QNU18952.1 AAA family ATPase [Geobacillus zalihae]WKA48980.1 AAA family ATPase [Geobacillus zalihae]